MTAFYFDVGGVLIPDQFAPDNSLNVFRDLGQRYGFNPDAAHRAYTELQPSLDMGMTSLTELCAAIGIEQKSFERDWLAMHPVNQPVVEVIDQLLGDGHSVGLATNFCRGLLDSLIESTGSLSSVVVCCSSDIGLAKPSPAFYRRASEMIGSEEVVFIDDRRANVDAAKRFGWVAIEAADGWLARFKSRYIRQEI